MAKSEVEKKESEMEIRFWKLHLTSNQLVPEAGSSPALSVLGANSSLCLSNLDWVFLFLW